VGAPAFWLGLRLLPAAASFGFVAAIFIPSYWRYEPREFVEGFDATLATVALAAVVLCAAALIRGAVSWARAARRVHEWLKVAQPLALSDTAIPAYRLDVDLPMMALVGVLRPRLVITRGVLDVLTDEELRAGVAHEIGHWRAFDNVKRLAMHAAPDLLGALPAARVIERRWASAAEHLADGRASDAEDAAERNRARCALASALVKVARLMPPRTPLADPISTLVDGGDIASRVHSLLDDAPPLPPRSVDRRWPVLAAVAAAVLAYVPLLHAVHVVTELIVQGF
jgi:Zn-dependent protease with chaperone function